MATYLKTETFRLAAESIATLEPCPFAGVVTADQVKLALGEHLDIWPQSVRPDDEEDKAVNPKAVNEIMEQNRKRDDLIEKKISDLIKRYFKGSEQEAALDWLDRKELQNYSDSALN